MNLTSAALAIAFLVTVAAALLCTAVFALFGNPSSHAWKKRRQNVVNGFRLAGGVLLGIALVGSLVACSGIAFGTIQSARLSKVTAFFIALGSLALTLSMIQRWAKYFVGWVGYSVLNGLLMVSSGHLVNNSSILVPRWWSISGTALSFLSALEHFQCRCIVDYGEALRQTGNGEIVWGRSAAQTAAGP